MSGPEQIPVALVSLTLYVCHGFDFLCLDRTIGERALLFLLAGLDLWVFAALSRFRADRFLFSFCSWL